MTESTPATQAEPTVAEKRQVLRNAGVTVGSRGKLSAEHEAKYAELTAGQTSQA